MPNFLTRRRFLQAGSLMGAAALARPALGDFTPGLLPVEPVAINHEPQFLFDLHVVDCTWALKEKQQPVRRVFHSVKKHGDQPVLTGGQPSNFTIVRDEPDGPFRLWYQLNHTIEYPAGKAAGQPAFQSFVAYAESADGIHWEKPNLNLFPGVAGKALPPNCVLYRPDSPETKFDAPQFVDAPERDRRGYRYLLTYSGGGANKAYRGIRLVGSHEGIHWDLANDSLIAEIHSDSHNTVVYDPRRDEYALYLRAKHIYLAPGQGRDRIDAGQSRRGVARMASKELWKPFPGKPQTIIVPDETDAAAGYNHFYGMPTRYYAGVYWGFLQSFRLNDYLHGELALSRDGINFQRLPWRPKIVEYGPDGAWDDTMILATSRWVEVGDEWWFYYNGWDGPHETAERTGSIGLAKLRKEGLISLRGPAGGGVVCTRALQWPGGELVVNADAHAGELRVRVSDELRKPIEGFNYDDGPTFTGDAVAQEIRWKGGSLDALRDRPIRVEFYLKDADLYTFRAASESRKRTSETTSASFKSSPQRRLSALVGG